MNDEQIYQVLTEDRYGCPVLQQWFSSAEEAAKCKEDCQRFWPESNFWIEEGTDHVVEKCRGCGTVHASECFDAYGIHTGYWCLNCYTSTKYPYRKDRYDYQGAGERLEEDY
jgi:hypothetical protein